jgi:uncharacterized YigZ family protein
MNAFKDEIIIVSKPLKAELKEKGSIFTANSFHVKNEKEADQFLYEVKKTNYNASHYCYAFKLQNEIIKYSDAGEPSGTAGIRILNAIEHFCLTDILVIVTRYFGGIKLGTGLLGKTYYQAAFNVLDKAEKIKLTAVSEITIEVDFPLMNKIRHLLQVHKAQIEKTTYTEIVTFVCFIKPELIHTLEKETKNISKGNVKFIKNEKIQYIALRET